MRFLTRGTLVRFLRARDGDVAAATAMLRATLLWRRSESVEDITAASVERVRALGATYITRGRDRSGCRIVVMRAGAYQPYDASERLRYIIWLMEQVFPPGDAAEDLTQATWLLDFSLFGKKRSPDGRVVMKNTQAILNDHYPERLGKAFLIDLPWYFSWLIRVAMLFMTAKTQSKIVIVSGTVEQKRQVLQEFIDLDQLEVRFGGTIADVPYSEPDGAPSATGAGGSNS